MHWPAGRAHTKEKLGRWDAHVRKRLTRYLACAGELAPYVTYKLPISVITSANPSVFIFRGGLWSDRNALNLASRWRETAFFQRKYQRRVLRSEATNGSRRIARAYEARSFTSFRTRFCRVSRAETILSLRRRILTQSFVPGRRDPSLRSG